MRTAYVYSQVAQGQRYPSNPTATEHRQLLAGKLRHMFLFITLNQHTYYFHE